MIRWTVRVGFLLVALCLIQGCETPRQKEARIAFTKAVADSAAQKAVAQVMDQVSDINQRVLRTQSQTSTQMDSLRAVILTAAAKGGGASAELVNQALNNLADRQKQLADDVRAQMDGMSKSFKAEIADSMQTVRGGMADLRKKDDEIVTGVSKTLAAVYPHIFKGKMETSGKWRWNWYWYETVKPPLREPTAEELAKGFPEAK